MPRKDRQANDKDLPKLAAADERCDAVTADGHGV